ncbi:DEAD/DEAH box helicase [Bacillus benzoevorans]|uniref:Competence protein ComFA n=1 Tax=Bacillus benzoevorans TaxID=1456 RepID=A0A7X0HUS1_9BACI|nr:DEAD/DEAH box helicase [Bacillus benzoevorans]MBB6447274.1 competence protein ComFA [Bacillus benzoevorans]
MLTGKQLLLEDLPFPIEAIQSHYENGFLIYRKGIIMENNKAKCIRCGNQESRLFASFPCARCGETCTYCRKCIMMGRVSACSPLVSWTGPDPDAMSKLESNPSEANEMPPLEIQQILANISDNFHAKNNHLPLQDSPPTSKLSHTSKGDSLLQWSGTLSSGQQHASERVVEAVCQTQSLLVWAVCGAGKTEVLFQGINAALMEGKRVCIATPRTDVVLELAPRLQKVFPTITVAVLYGGSKDRHLYAPLTISTTHQLLRFFQAFDTIIVDEVDAFPFSAEETLQYAVEQARKPVSALIFLTATPNAALQKECRLGKRNFVTIPARFHRHSLPVPRFVWCGNWRKGLYKGSLPPNVLTWLKQRISAEKQVLLFFPRIELMERLLPIMKKIHPKIESVHAEDPQRKEKVQAMRNKEIPILLTTTILERGVTFPNLDVAVLGAEDRIFTESALVQIAGRVGRSPDYPSGDITFFHHGKTEAMVKARKQILAMNKEAREKGLIDD